MKSRSLNPPPIHPAWWLLLTMLVSALTVFTALNAVGGGRETTLVEWIAPLVFLTAAVGLSFGTRRALKQLRVAESATLYSLESIDKRSRETETRRAA